MNPEKHHKWLLAHLPSTPEIERRRRYNLSQTLDNTLDRVKVLGNDADYGHSGCVNALSWAQDGDVLLTAGDDTTVRIWSMYQSNTGGDYPFSCRAVISTGHQANIFNAKMLPLSSRIATAAGDMQIRVFDAAAALHSSLLPGDIETNYSANQCNLRVLRCHHDSVKKIVTEESPDLFLSVSEDGTVRQHDLRTSHTCRRRSCPEPLVSIGHELSTLSLSPLVPYQFVVAGEGDCGYLYDRRHLRRKLEVDWGSVPRFGEELTTCVRKFGRENVEVEWPRGKYPYAVYLCEHARVLKASSLGYSVRDGVYLFSTKDEPMIKDNFASRASPILPPNRDNDQETPGPRDGSGNITNYDVSVNDEEPTTPIVMPRRRYVGARNVMTVKDVNFLGPDDEWVVSGSDDGNFFIWDRRNGSLKGIYEGDGSVVNVIEGHPHFPLLAISGIDTTVKLFAPTLKPSPFSRIENAEQIVETNRHMSTTRLPARFRLASLLGDAHIVNTASGDGNPSECIGQ